MSTISDVPPEPHRPTFIRDALLLGMVCVAGLAANFICITVMTPFTGQPPPYEWNVSYGRKLLLVVLVAPFCETFILWSTLSIARRLLSKPAAIAALGSLPFLLLHATDGWQVPLFIAGGVITWGFCYAWLHSHGRSKWAKFTFLFLPHVVNNAFVMATEHLR